MIRNERPVIANSLWSATAHRTLDFPVPKGARRADVAVVGAGFTGLSAALHLAEGGASVVLMGAQQPGRGASGRNGGRINVGLKDRPSGIIATYGEDWGRRMIRMVGNAGDLVFELIARHDRDFPTSAIRPLPFAFAHNVAVEAEILRLRLMDKLGL